MLPGVTPSPTARARHRWANRGAATACCAMIGAASGDARAAAPPTSSAVDEKSEVVAGPPNTRRAYVQYGVAFTVEDVLSAGPICPGNPCILGSGGGVAGRIGFRPTERFYIGGTYELSKQEPNKLYLLGILQQIRGELRNYFPNGSRTTPFVVAAAGVAGYGNEWAVDTWGPSVALGAGLEFQLSGGTLLNLALLYRPIYLGAFVDSSTTSHGAGFAQFLGLELAIEAQDAL
jgi:hypothetical protein